MYYCDSPTTWATVDDLYSRFGDEYMDKLGTRRVYDSTLGSYVANQDPDAILRVIETALCDARALLLYKLSCLYLNLSLLDKKVFLSIKQWHMKLTIETLKIGGDCLACECNANIDEFLKCGNICSVDGECLVSNKTFISVSDAKFCCELMGRGCKCC